MVVTKDDITYKNSLKPNIRILRKGSSKKGSARKKTTRDEVVEVK
jgi:hypothetical protein